MNCHRLFGLLACSAALSSATIPCNGSAALGATVFSFYHGSDLPDLGIASYAGVENVRLNDSGAGLNTAMTNQALFWGDSGNNADNRALLGFDVAALTGWQATGDATLRFRVRNTDGTVDGSDVFELYRIFSTNAGFAHGRSSWNHLDQPNTTPWRDAADGPLPTGVSPNGGLGAPGDGYEGTPLATLSQSSYPTNSYVTFTIPQAVVQGMVNGFNPGFLIRHQDENLAGRLEVADRRGGANGPMLTVLAELPPDPSHYAAAVTADNPLAYYRLSETGGAIAANRANPAGYGTYSGEPALGQPAPGPAGGFHGFGADNYAVGLDGVDDHVAVPALGVSGNSARTYEGWFNGTDATQGFFSIAGGTGRQTGITASNSEVSMAVNGHRFGVTFDAANYGTPQDNKYTPAELGAGWHHFAITFPEGGANSDQWQFIVNGVDYTSLARNLAGSPQTVNTLDNPGRLGMTHGGNPIAGTIDEFAVYSGDLGRQGVADHFAAALGPDWSIAETTFEMSRFQSVSLGSHSDWPDGATGTDRSDVLRVRERTAAQSTNPVRTRAFLEFDLASLEDQEVLGAILTLNQDSRNVNTGFLQLARVTDAWTVDTLGFEQGVDDIFRFGGTNTTPTPGDDKPSWIDVTDIVREWVNGETENHGFRLAFDEQSFVIADFFAAGEFAPQLIVTTAVPEPGAWLLLLAALTCGLLVRRRGKE